MFLWLVVIAVRALVILVSLSRSATPGGVSLLNVSLPPGWTVAAVGSLFLFAALALGIAAWQPAFAYYMTADSAGNVDAILGTNLVRWDASGKRTLDVNLALRPFDVTNASHLAPGADGEILVADQDHERVLRISSAGLLSGTISAPQRDETTLMGFVAPLSVVAKGRSVWVLRDGKVMRTDGTLPATVAYDDPKARWASDIAIDSNGAMLIADPGFGRVIRVAAGQTTAIDCLRLGTEYCYPDIVTAAPDGSILTVLRKRWMSNMFVPWLSGLPYGTFRRPNPWMGEMYRLSKDGGQPLLVEVHANGRSLPIFDVTSLPNGAVGVTPLGTQGLYVADPVTGKALRFEDGDLGATLRTADTQARLRTAAPQTLGGFAVLFPIVFGVLGAAAAIRRRSGGAFGPVAGPPMMPTRPIPSQGGYYSQVAQTAPVAPMAAPEPALGFASQRPAARADVTVESAGNVRRRMMWVMVSVMAVSGVFSAGSVWFQLSLLRTSSSRFTLALIPMSIFMMLIPLVLLGYLVWALRKRASYTFAAQGLCGTRGKIIRTWPSVQALTFSGASSISSDAAIVLTGGASPDGPQVLRLSTADLGLEAARQMVPELIARVSPELIDPTLLVLRDFLRSADAEIACQNLDPRAEKAMRSLQFPAIVSALWRRQKESPSLTNTLLLGQALLLSGRYRQSSEMLEPILGSGADPRVVLCAALAAFRGKDEARSAALLGQIVDAENQDVIDAFRRRMRLDPPTQKAPALVVWATAGALILFAGLRMWAAFVR